MGNHTARRVVIPVNTQGVKWIHHAETADKPIKGGELAQHQMRNRKTMGSVLKMRRKKTKLHAKQEQLPPQQQPKNPLAELLRTKE